MKSLKEIYRIGKGPSSSHTMGPMKAAQIYAQRHPEAKRFEVTLYGSLAATGKGHMTDVAITEGLKPVGPVDIIWNARERLPYHPNGMLFKAIDADGNLFREKDGKLLFRPGGHGALIENLNDLAQEIVFVKNIDNIVPETKAKTTIIYKKVLAGLLLHLQQQTFEYLDMLDEGSVGEEELEKIIQFAKTQLMIDIPEFVNDYNAIEKVDYLYNKLNRPMRVCGMVKNEGEPGGGPFWVKNDDDEVSLQIIESSQIDHGNAAQEAIFKASTHFNPVDLVCGCWNYKGEAFNLTDYVDPNTGFVSNKSKDGRELRALELPGLWNGAMADWITVFVEVPIETFNPVKTVNDLLRPQHQ